MHFRESFQSRKDYIVEESMERGNFPWVIFGKFPRDVWKEAFQQTALFLSKGLRMNFPEISNGGKGYTGESEIQNWAELHG